jgi:hypothetical protein
MRQREVASLTKTGQSAISRIEKAEYDGWTFKTLIGIADALRARLRISFEPIEAVALSYQAQEPLTIDDIATVTTMMPGVGMTNAGATSAGIVDLNVGIPNDRIRFLRSDSSSPSQTVVN